MRFEKDTPAGRYSITILFAENADHDPDELQVTVGFSPAGRTQETFRASFYMVVVDDRYVPYGLTYQGKAPCQIKQLDQAIARCAYRFLLHHAIPSPVRVVEW